MICSFLLSDMPVTSNPKETVLGTVGEPSGVGRVNTIVLVPAAFGLLKPVQPLEPMKLDSEQDTPANVIVLGVTK